MISRAGGRRCGQRHKRTVQQILDHIIAPLYHHIAFALPIEDGYADRLVRDVLAMGR
jgi:hypothetical protein